MALIEGTTAGFVIVAPTGDPSGTNDGTMDGNSRAQLVTSPAGATKITEVGWYCINSTQESNFEMGLYDTTGTDGQAGALLNVSRTNAKGTTSGWKTISVDWTISESTDYWIAVQLDETPIIGTTINYEGGGLGAGTQYDLTNGSITLSDPADTASYNYVGGLIAVYAVYTLQKTIQGLQTIQGVSSITL